MNPYLTAVEFFDKNEQLEEFGECLHQYHLHGFVHSTPDYFIMAKPISRGAMNEEILNSSKFWDRNTQDCWYIRYASGNIAKATELWPYFLPYVGFHRMHNGENSLRIYGFRNINRVIEHFKTKD